MNRRTAGATLIGLGGGLLVARPLLAGRPRVRGDLPAVPNSTFYDAEGRFLESVAKSTYLALIASQAGGEEQQDVPFRELLPTSL